MAKEEKSEKGLELLSDECLAAICEACEDWDGRYAEVPKEAFRELSRRTPDR